MQHDTMDCEPIGQITKGIQPNTLVQYAIDFLQQQLPAWRDDPNRKPELTEIRLTSQLSKHLNPLAQMIQFTTEEPQDGRYSIDLSVAPIKVMFIDGWQYTNYDCFLYIECKRLPTPTPPKAREREYVTGGKTKRSGALQRFKLGLHAHKHNLTVVIGYVQKRSCAEWYRTINYWINDLIVGNEQDDCDWHDGEQLGQYAEDQRGLARCESDHQRQNGNDIHIVHLWIDMCSICKALCNL